MPIASGRIGLAPGIKAKPGKGPHRGLPWRSKELSRFSAVPPATSAVPALVEDWTAASPSGNFSVTRAGANATYIDTTGTRQTAAANTPRMHSRWNGSTWAQVGVLVEPGYNNLVFNSDDLSAATYTKNQVTATKPGTTGADNSTLMVQIAGNSVNTTHNVYRNTGSSGISSNQSFYCGWDIKKGTWNFVFCCANASGLTGGWVGVVVNLTSGAVISEISKGTAGTFDISPVITVLRNGIYRVEFVAHFTGSITTINTPIGFVGAASGNTYAASNGDSSCLVAATDTIFLGGEMHAISTELCQHIVTGAAAVSTPADVFECTTGFGSLSTGGYAVVIEAEASYGQADDEYLEARGGGGGADVVDLYLTSRTQWETYTTGTLDAAINPALAGGSVFRWAASFDTSRAAMSINGGPVASGLPPTLFAPDTFYLGSAEGTSSFAHTVFRSIAIYPQPLDDSQLKYFSTSGVGYVYALASAVYDVSISFGVTQGIGPASVHDSIQASATSLTHAVISASALDVILAAVSGSTHSVIGASTGQTTAPVSFNIGMGVGDVFQPADIFAVPDVFYLITATLNAVGNISLGATHAESSSVTDNMQATAAIAIHPVIAAAGLELMTASASLAFATAETPLGTEIMTALASLNVAPAIVAVGGLLQTGNAALTFANAEASSGQLNLTGQGAIAIHPVIAAAGLELMTAPAVLSVTTAETPAGSLNLTAQAALAVQPATIAVGGLLIPASASLSFSPVIAALGTETLQLAATFGLSPAIAALGSISYTASAALAVATAIVAAGQIISTKTASMSVTTGLSASALEIINAAASLAVSTAIAAVGGASYTNAAALNVAAGLAGSSSVTFNLSTAFAETAGITALAAPMNLTSAAILSTSPAIAGAGTFIATASASLATTTAETPAGTMLMSAASTIALHPAQTDTGALSAILGATLGVISAIGGTVTGSLQGSGGASGTFTASPNGNISAIVAAALNARPAIDASLGNLFILSMALAVVATESSSSALTATGQAALSASPAEAAAVTEIMSAAAALNVSPALAASASDVMAAAATISTAFVEAALLDAGGANYTNTAALSGAFGSNAAPSVNMLTALFLASSVAQAGSGAVGASVSTTLTTQPGTSVAGLLTVTGSISLPAGVGLSASLQVGAGARATFSATFDAEAGNILDATAAVSLATRLATIAVLLSSEPAVDSVAARGVLQGTIDLAGVYEALKTISGIVPGGDLAGRLAGEQALTGVVDLTIDLE